MLLITHSLGVVTEYCDRIAVLYAGERLESGTVEAVQQQPGHPYTRMLLDCEVPLDRKPRTPMPDNRFTVIGGELPDPLQAAAWLHLQRRAAMSRSRSAAT